MLCPSHLSSTRPLIDPSVFFRRLRRPPTPTLFPYTTLFRSRHQGRLPDPIRRRRLHFPHRLQDCREKSKRADIALPLNNRGQMRSEEHTSELQSRENLVCRLLLEKKKKDVLP